MTKEMDSGRWRTDLREGRCYVATNALEPSGKDKGGVTRIMIAKGEVNAKECEKQSSGVRGVPILVSGAGRGIGTMKAGESTAGEVGAVPGAGAGRDGESETMKDEEGTRLSLSQAPSS